MRLNIHIKDIPF